MLRETLDRKLQNLIDEILVIDSMVETALVESVNALKNRDLKLAQQIYDNDELINQKRFELENDIIITIATTQPVMAGDLRLVASVLEVVGELERMGDYAKGIAKIALLMGGEPPVKPLIDIPRMVNICVSMRGLLLIRTPNLPDRSLRKTIRWTPCTSRSTANW